MMSTLSDEKVKPLCPVFGVCGGCAYQDLSYEEELRRKFVELRDLFSIELAGTEQLLQPVVASPEFYHYRHRLDLAFRRDKSGQFHFGFVGGTPKRIIEISSCAIAQQAVSDFLPRLKEEAIRIFPPKYKVANLVVKTGEDEKILWGGIGKGSLHQKPENYLWVELAGKKIFFSLDTFFQANFSILPRLYETLSAWPWSEQTILLDLYGGVGLFSVWFADRVKKVLMIEENCHSVSLAEHNRNYHQFQNWEILSRRVEDVLPEVLAKENSNECLAIVDPPRKGLEESAALCLAKSSLKHLFYLSCNPLTLVRDLKFFLREAWEIEKIIPFDFFPRTSHLEVLVKLRKNL